MEDNTSNIVLLKTNDDIKKDEIEQSKSNIIDQLKADLNNAIEDGSLGYFLVNLLVNWRDDRKTKYFSASLTYEDRRILIHRAIYAWFKEMDRDV